VSLDGPVIWNDDRLEKCCVPKTEPRLNSEGKVCLPEKLATTVSCLGDPAEEFILIGRPRTGESYMSPAMR